MPYRKYEKKVAKIRIAGPDKKGIIATITGYLFRSGCNIEDIDQRILEGYLIMNMLVDYTGLSIPLKKFLQELKNEGKRVGVDAEFVSEDKKKIKNVAILVTKEAHCLVTLLKTLRGRLSKGKSAVIIGNHKSLKPIADQFKIPFHFVSSDKKRIHEQKVLNLLQKYKTDLVVLARYMQILSPEFVFRYEGKIINIHPSLLPAFPGPRSYHQAYNKGVEVVGVTAHFVTTDLDEGPIITQGSFRVDKTRDTVDDFIRKGQKLEAAVLVRAVKLFVDDRLALRRGKVIDSRNLHAFIEKTRRFYQ